MNSMNITTFKNAKAAPDGVGAPIPQVGETSKRIVNALKDLYVFPAVAIGRLFGVSDKTAKRKLKHERVLSDDEIGCLLRSDSGFEVLTAIMGDAKPAWWRILVPLKDAADARQVQIAARRRLKKTIESALDADKHLSAAINYAEALSDQDHTGPYVDALRSMARVPDRALAPKGKR